MSYSKKKDLPPIEQFVKYRKKNDKEQIFCYADIDNYSDEIVFRYWFQEYLYEIIMALGNIKSEKSAEYILKIIEKYTGIETKDYHINLFAYCFGSLANIYDSNISAKVKQYIDIFNVKLKNIKTTFNKDDLPPKKWTL